MANSRIIIAESLGMDYADIEEYRYQSTRTRKPVYAIGNEYFTVSKSHPKECDLNWSVYRDQFHANKNGTVLWTANGTAA